MLADQTDINRRRVTTYMDNVSQRDIIRRLAFEETVSESVMARKLLLEALKARGEKVEGET